MQLFTKGIPHRDSVDDGPLRSTPCDLCRSVDFELISRRDRRGKQLDTVVCCCCGLVSHRHIPSDAELDEFYGQRYRREYHGETSPSAYRVVRAWQTGERLFGLLKDDVRPGDRVFEVGAGIGCTVKMFELGGFHAAGIEPGEDFQAFSHERLRAKVHRGKLADLPLERSYDFVLLVHVIEHFNFPRRALETIHQILRPGGRIYVECPNVGAPHAAPGKLFHFAHVHNFTHETLRMLAQAAGFRLQRQISSDGDAALAMVFAMDAEAQLTIDPGSYHRTMAALKQFNAVTYHLRPEYLISRMSRIWSLYTGYLGADRRLAEILDRCRQQNEAPAGSDACEAA